LSDVVFELFNQILMKLSNIGFVQDDLSKHIFTQKNAKWVVKNPRYCIENAAQDYPLHKISNQTLIKGKQIEGTQDKHDSTIHKGLSIKDVRTFQLSGTDILRTKGVLQMRTPAL